MKAKRGGRKTWVFTEPGPDAYVRDVPAAVEHIPITTPQDVIHNPPAELAPERVCPHGGLYFHNMPVCGLCNNDVKNEQLFGLAVMHVSRKVAYKIPVSSAAFEFNDVLMVAATALVENRNRKRILTARNPAAMAFTIAHRAALKLFRSRSVKALAVGKIDFDSAASDDDPLETTSQRLEYLDAMRQVSEQNAEWAQQCYERARTFPGLHLMWTDENFNRLQEAIDKGRRQLPTTPFNVWFIIDMRLGLSEGMEEHTWEEIAGTLENNITWKPLTARQVRYAYNEGLKFLKAHLLKTLVPDTVTHVHKSAG